MTNSPDDPNALLTLFNAAADAATAPAGMRWASPSECAALGYAPPLNVTGAARVKALAGFRVLLPARDEAGEDIWQGEALALLAAQEAAAKLRGERPEPSPSLRASEGVSRFTMRVIDSTPSPDSGIQLAKVPEDVGKHPPGSRFVRC